MNVEERNSSFCKRNGRLASLRVTPKFIFSPLLLLIRARAKMRMVKDEAYFLCNTITNLTASLKEKTLFQYVERETKIN